MPESLATRIRINWTKYRELSPLLVPKGLSLSESKADCILVCKGMYYSVVKHGLLLLWICIGLEEIKLICFDG